MAYFLLYCFVCLVSVVWAGGDVKTAIVVLQNNGTNQVQGTISFTQEDDGDLTVRVIASGLAPNSEHGFHVHEYGDTSNFHKQPPSTGFHFSPPCAPEANCTEDQVHGLPPATTRHAGDMGNVQADGTGNIDETIVIGQGKMSLSDTGRSILGRAVVFHASADDGGQPYGNAGDVAAAGVIAIREGSSASIASALPVTSLLCIMHDLDELDTSPDTNARAYFEYDLNDIRTPARVRIFARDTLASASPYVQLVTRGDLTNVPTSTGAAYQHAMGGFESCEGGAHSYHQSSVADHWDAADLIGRGCVLRTGGATGDIIAAGTIGFANPDEADTIFAANYFSYGGSCDKPSSSGIGGGAIAGIVIGVLAGVAIVGLLVFNRDRFAGSKRKSSVIDYTTAPFNEEVLPPRPAGRPPSQRVPQTEVDKVRAEEP